MRPTRGQGSTESWIGGFSSLPAAAVGLALTSAGFLLRLWATYTSSTPTGSGVVRLEPQGELITSGPFRYTRNPLYLGGDVFVFLGCCLMLGTPSGVALTALHLPLVDRMIRREERQLEERFWGRVAGVREEGEAVALGRFSGISSLLWLGVPAKSSP